MFSLLVLPFLFHDVSAMSARNRKMVRQEESVARNYAQLSQRPQAFHGSIMHAQPTLTGAQKLLVACVAFAALTVPLIPCARAEHICSRACQQNIGIYDDLEPEGKDIKSYYTDTCEHEWCCRNTHRNPVAHACCEATAPFDRNNLSSDAALEISNCYDLKASWLSQRTRYLHEKIDDYHKRVKVYRKISDDPQNSNKQ